MRNEMQIVVEIEDRKNRIKDRRQTVSIGMSPKSKWRCRPAAFDPSEWVIKRKGTAMGDLKGDEHKSNRQFGRRKKKSRIAIERVTARDRAWVPRG